MEPHVVVQPAREPRVLLDPGVARLDHASVGLGARDAIPRTPDLGVQLGIGIHPSLKLLFGGALGGQHRILVQRVEQLAAHLDRVLEAEQAVLDPPVGLGARLAELDEPAAQLGAAQQPDGERHVAHLQQLGHGVQALGLAGMSGHEHRLALGGTGEIDR